MAFTQFVMTTAGNAAVAGAAPAGPYVNITSFAVGSGVNYTPSATDFALRGTLLYQGVPTSYYKIAPDTVAVVLTLPPEVGPFEYGEIGIYNGTTLLGLATFQQLRQKLSLTVDGIPHTPRIRALIKLAQAPAIFSITTTSQNNVMEVPDFTYVTQPDAMVGQPNVVIVHENSSCGDAVMLIRNSAVAWTPLKYTFLGDYELTQQTGLTINSASFVGLNTNSAGRYIVQFEEGYIRQISAVAGEIAFLTHPVIFTSNLTVRVYEADCARDAVDTDEVSDLWTTFNKIWGTPNEMGFGWGQNEVPFPAGARPTVAEWTNLTEKINAAVLSSGRIPAFSIAGLASRFVPDRTRKQVRLNMAYKYVDDLYQKKNRLRQSQSTDERVNYTIPLFGVNTGAWEQRHIDTLVTFPSETAAQAFFNSGGSIGIRFRTTRHDHVYSTIQRVTELLGNINFAAFDVYSTGALKIRYDTADGIVTDLHPDGGFLNSSGYYAITNVRKKMFSYTHSLGGVSQGMLDESLIIEVYASRLTSTSIVLEFWITQTAFDAGADNLVASRVTDAGARVSLNTTLYAHTQGNFWSQHSNLRMDGYIVVASPLTSLLPQSAQNMPTITSRSSTDFGTILTN